MSKDEYEKAIEKHGKKILKQATKLADIINKFPTRYQCCALEAAVTSMLNDLDQSLHQATGALFEVITKHYKPRVSIVDMTEMLQEATKSAKRYQRPDKTPRV